MKKTSTMDQPIQMVQITTMTDSEQEAVLIATTLTRERIAACCQVSGPVQSVYWWKGQMEQTAEWQCLVKTREDLYETVEAGIMALHSYEVPAIIAVPVVHGSEAYLAWRTAETEAG